MPFPIKVESITPEVLTPEAIIQRAKNWLSEAKSCKMPEGINAKEAQGHLKSVQLALDKVAAPSNDGEKKELVGHLSGIIEINFPWEPEVLQRKCDRLLNYMRQ
jgi:hypothetical protein